MSQTLYQQNSQKRFYNYVFNLVESLAGVGQFATSEKTDIGRFINRRLEMIYNASNAWPDYLVANQRRAISSFFVDGLKVDTREIPSEGNGLYFLIGYADPGTYGYEDDGSLKPLYARTSDYTIGQNINFDQSQIGGPTINWYNFVFSKNVFQTSDAYKDRWVLSNATIGFNRFGKALNNSKVADDTPLFTGTQTAMLYSQESGTNEVSNPADAAKYTLENPTSPPLYLGNNITVERKQCIDFFGFNFSTVGAKGSSGGNFSNIDQGIIQDRQNMGLSGYDIGKFIRIHRTKPYVNQSASEYDFYVDQYGANILNAVTSDEQAAYVTYKKPLVLLNTPNTQPDGSPRSQSTEAIPTAFVQYIAQGAYADFLTMDGQISKSVVENKLADEILAKELEQIDIMYNNNRPIGKFSTYVNRQSR